ncbi:MAG: hypothetical protein LLG37_06835 [Spirochaetia bacterium]|nr:hypothetical protein [Spirochaetia bacterium]
MKNFVLFLAVVFALFCAFPVMAEDIATQPAGDTAAVKGTTASADNIISVNVWPMVGGFFNLGYERKIADIMSVRVRGLYWSLFNMFLAGNANFVGTGVDMFFYPAGKACKEFFAGPRLDYFYIGNQDWNLQIMMAGGQIGYRWLFEGGFEIALILGAWCNVSNKASDGAEITSIGVLSGVLPTFDFELGWAF